LNRHLTVKGIGQLSLKPDLVVISMNLENLHLDYDQAMRMATDAVDHLAEAIESAGYNRIDLKTTRFNVRTQYSSYKDKNDQYRNRFEGYVCEHGLSFEFDFTASALSRVLSAITGASANPQLDIRFSVKDKAAVNEALLISATDNASKKAEILAKAAGVQLGELISIDYNWSELRLFSTASYEMESRVMSMKASSAPDIEPEDIDVSDQVTLVWEIN